MFILCIYYKYYYTYSMHSISNLILAFSFCESVLRTGLQESGLLFALYDFHEKKTARLNLEADVKKSFHEEHGAFLPSFGATLR